ncbi:SOS response-associated peptidase [Winogradskyella forsetii]|uniref:SOS response-associated peptidase n=1 Tax=Winogradskyella forsetii TaxID=2686077 RepID=UPI0015BF31AA|nr:SOS response-associated peptidase [Winogradskyella forsetii]
MCYGKALTKSEDELKEQLNNRYGINFAVPSAYKPYYHLNGFTHGTIYIIPMDDPEHICAASWGMIPDWAAHDPETFWRKSNTLNARSETIFEKPTFKNSADDKRCLILADGFYEPHHENGVALPYFCYQPSKTYPKGDLFMFAGLYNKLDTELYTATILTTEANPFFAEVHNKKKRMPLVLADDLFEDWLDAGLNSQTLLELMDFGFTNKAFKAHPVSRDLYKKGIDTNQPYITEAVDKGTLF